MKIFYPMTSVEISGERGCWEMRSFPTLSHPHSHGSWNKSKNLYPYLYSACGLVVPGPQQLPSWELCNFSTGMDSCYIVGSKICIQLQYIRPKKSSMGGRITTRALGQKIAVSMQPVAARNQLPFKPKC